MTVQQLRVAIPANTRGPESPRYLEIGNRRGSMSACCRDAETVVTIAGDIDAANADEVLDFANLFMPLAGTATLDLSGVGFFAAQCISLLKNVEELCRTAGVSWEVIPSDAIRRVTRLRTASGVSDA
ncbi:STAS domain-containing protein [Mycolicibacterium sp. CBM1]